MNRRAPDPDEYEITVFGAGFGECAVIHVGDGYWIVIDSCLDGSEKRPVPVAVNYLNGIGVKLESQVRLIVATHWHEDHLKGIADLFKLCRSADFALPTPCSATKINEVLARAKSSPSARSTAVVELAEVFLEISRRKNLGENCERQYCHSGSLIPVKGTEKTGLKVLALSPSNEVCARAEEWIVHLCSQSGHLTFVDVPESNEISLAMWLDLNDGSWVFGADLEDGSSVDEGWKQVVNRFAARLSGAEFIKVPHHGSSGAHNDEFWKKMLKQKPLGFVTSYNKGTNPPPTKEDLKRLYLACEKIYFAGGNKNVVGTGRAVAHLQATGVKMQTVGYYSSGRITMRRKSVGNVRKWKVVTDGKASLVSRSILGRHLGR